MCLKCSRKRDSATKQNISNDFKYTNAHRLSIFLPLFTTLLVTPARCIYLCVCYIIWWRHEHRNLIFFQICESSIFVWMELLFNLIWIHMNPSISIPSKENCIWRKLFLEVWKINWCLERMNKMHLKVFECLFVIDSKHDDLKNQSFLFYT